MPDATAGKLGFHDHQVEGGESFIQSVSGHLAFTSTPRRMCTNMNQTADYRATFDLRVLISNKVPLGLSYGCAVLLFDSIGLANNRQPFQGLR